MSPTHRAYLNSEGNLVLPPDLARFYGLVPGSEIRLDEYAARLVLHPPLTHLAKIYIEPTSRCNLTCRTCIRNAWQEPLGRMTLATFEHIMEGVRSLPTPPTIFFGGFGEPLSHSKIVRMVAQARQATAEVELITNGMLLTEARSRELIQAGLSTLWVSVDGATPESYADIRLGAALPKILNNITRYHDLYRQIIGGEPKLGLVFVAMKRNIADLPKLLRMSTRLGISHYLVTNVLPYTREMCEEMLYSRAVDNFASQPSLWSPNLDFPPMDVNQDTREALLQMLSTHRRNFMLEGGQAQVQNTCPFVHRRSAAIAWNGDLSPCLPLMHSHTSFLQGKPRTVQRYTFGNIHNQSLVELWQSQPSLAFRQRVDAFDFSPCSVCASCEMSDANQEDCFGNTFPTCGGCLWAQGFIRCP